MTKIINEYKTSLLNLAVKMAEIRKIQGRKALEDTLGFDVARINTLCGIGDIYDPSYPQLLPEHWAELVGENEADRKRYIKVILQKGMKPSQLRKYIRQDKSCLQGEEKNIKVNGWAKNILLLENDIKNMNPEEKKRALSHITNTLLSI